MRTLMLCVLLALVMGLPAVAGAEDTTLVATKDAKVMWHQQDEELNSGASNRLRTKGVVKNSCEVVIMDFDRAALKELLEKNAGKETAAKLVLAVMAFDGEPTSIEVAALDCGVDWPEGNKDVKAAEKGESCYLAAQKDVKKWTTAGGQEVDNFKELFYDKEADKVKTTANGKRTEATKDSKTVEIPLDADFVKHLATDANCRGLVVFHRDNKTKADFYSRDEKGKEPKLVVSVK